MQFKTKKLQKYHIERVLNSTNSLFYTKKEEEEIIIKLLEKKDLGKRFAYISPGIFEQIDSSYILPIIESSFGHREPFIAMRYMNKGSLIDQKEDLSIIEKCLMLHDTVCGIEYLHSKGLVHGEVRLDNIFLHEQDGIQYSYLRYEGAPIRRYRATQANAYHLPLNTVKKKKRITVYDDLHSIGVLILELFTGKRKYDYDSLEESKRCLAEHISDIELQRLLVGDKNTNTIGIYEALIKEDGKRYVDGVRSVVQLLQRTTKNGYKRNERSKKKGIIFYLDQLEEHHTLGNMLYAIKPVQQRYVEELFNIGIEYLMGKYGNRDNAKKYLGAAAKRGHPKACLKLGEYYLKMSKTEEEYQQALMLYEKAAKYGEIEAYYMLGIMYAQGIGTQHDYKKAKYYLEYANEKKFLPAEHELGILYLKKESDYGKAQKCFMRLAEKGYVDAWYQLGKMYHENKHREGTRKEFVECFVYAAKKDHEEAMLALAIAYELGDVVKQNYLQAKKWYEKAARRGNNYALFKLGIFYFSGLGIEKDYDKAKEYFQQLINKNHPAGYHFMGLLHKETEQGEDRNQKVIEYITQAANLGALESLIYLGEMYEEGDGVEINIKKALEYYTKSAEKGDLFGLFKLGMLHYEGRAVEQNYRKARKYFQQAAAAGNKSAWWMLGKMYEKGEGVKKNQEKAQEYFKKYELG